MIKIQEYDVLIIGCGLTGCVVARYFAEHKNKKVLILEKRDHIGGNMYDYIDKNGVRVWSTCFSYQYPQVDAIYGNV